MAYDEEDDLGEPKKSLEELKAENLPHATWETVGLEDKGRTDPEFLEDLNAYFHHFAKPEGKCICCGARLGGFLGAFTWGLAHGHGFCSRCRWPATAYHFIKDRRGEDLCTLRGIILQAHPDDVERRSDEKPSSQAAE